MKYRTLAIVFAIASLVLASLACENEFVNVPLTETFQAFDETETAFALVPTETVLPTITVTPPAPSETPERQSGSCWALVEPLASVRQLEDDNRYTYKVTNAEGWLWSVMDWGYGGCQGQVSGLVTWTPLPDRLTPGQVIPILVTASIAGTEVCSPNYDWINSSGVAFSRFRIPPTGEEVAIARVETPGGPFESQATYQWTVPEAGPESIWVDYHIQVPGAYYAMLNYTYTWQETGNCTPGEILVNTPVPPAAITPQP